MCYIGYTMNELIALMSPENISILGFVLLLALLVWILFRGESRGAPSVVQQDPSSYPSDSPYHESNRRKAAAAAFAAHRQTLQGDPS